MPSPLNRRHLLSAAGAAGLAALTGCGGGRSSAEPAAGATDVPGFPFRYEHRFGTTLVPAPAQRVAVLGVTDADPLLALGVQPLTNTGFTFYPDKGLGPWAAGLQTGPLLKLGSDADVNVEQVAGVAPDLILALVSGIDQALYDKLSAVAPVLARPEGSTAYGADRTATTLTIARALGREDEGEELTEAADAAFTDAVAAHPEFAGKTGLVALPYDGRYGVFSPQDARGAFMENLGFSLTPEVAALDTGESFFIDVSAERLDLLDADVLVVLTDDSTRTGVEQDPVLQRLPVVQRGGLVLPDLDVRGAMTYNSVLSVPYGVSRLVPDLSAALA
ncbi:iron-siderophore ABC transporter substrate-binding protein [Kineococcus rhizosphaerae]|uniref:Iron complex transport system substrate-binding protein n=1 Tax=Kineococcus rhizosphaerae TaxID=559628 RepID=A0A2T0QV21_9ACTN|nr:iron-siderophore ABC transporter substrate-binding protein [Kineococcus rhizosphaerae]PRY09085.1 iron complex transport system substrate-binding protein [Kineococcus rhizosphaerae]